MNRCTFGLHKWVLITNITMTEEYSKMEPRTYTIEKCYECGKNKNGWVLDVYGYCIEDMHRIRKAFNSCLLYKPLQKKDKPRIRVVS